MPTPTYTDTTLSSLVISKISQAKFDELKNAGLLNEDELYIVENETLDAMGNVIKNVGTPVQNTDAANKAYVDGKTPPVATSSTAGIVKPDGTTITVDANGVISSSGGGGGGGATGYTVTFANDFSTNSNDDYYMTSAPVLLLFADGTSQELDVEQNQVQLRGQSFSNVVAICCGKWVAPDGHFAPGWNDGLDVVSNGKSIRVNARQCANSWTEQFFANYTSERTLTLFGDTLITNAEGRFNCLIGGTTIRLANGQDKPIEEITYDDELLVWDFDNGKFSSAKPLWIKSMQVSPFYFRNEFSDGRTLMTVGEPSTGGHRLFNLSKSMFTYSKETVGDEVYSLDGRISHVSCERIDEPCEFYNVITDKHMNLFANGILTSCRFNNLYPVKDMKFVKDNRRTRPFDAYDVPLEYYNGMRLSEQTIDPSEVNEYVKNLIDTAVERNKI